MHSKRMQSYVFVSALLAGYRSGAATDRMFPVFFDNASVTQDEPAQYIVTRASNVAGLPPLAAMMVEGYADDATTRTGGVHLSTDRRDVATASLVARGSNAFQVKRFGNGNAPTGKVSVSSLRVNIAIELLIGKP
jgi:hypothetical protein